MDWYCNTRAPDRLTTVPFHLTTLALGPNFMNPHLLASLVISLSETPETLRLDVNLSSPDLRAFLESEDPTRFAPLHLRRLRHFASTSLTHSLAIHVVRTSPALTRLEVYHPQILNLDDVFASVARPFETLVLTVIEQRSTSFPLKTFGIILYLAQELERENRALAVVPEVDAIECEGGRLGRGARG